MLKKIFLLTVFCALLVAPDAFARRRGLFGGVSGAVSAVRRSNNNSPRSTPVVVPRVARGAAAAAVVGGAATIAVPPVSASDSATGLDVIASPFGTQGIPPAPMRQENGAQSLGSVDAGPSLIAARDARSVDESTEEPAFNHQEVASTLPDTGGHPIWMATFGLALAALSFSLRRRLN